MIRGCEQFDVLRAQWADGSLAPDTAEALERHTKACPACAADARAQQVVHRVLRRHADALREQAPPALRARVTSLVGQRANVVPFAAARRPRSWAASRPWQWIPRSVAAALVLAVAGVFAAGALAPAGSVLAWETALDHLKCRLIAAVDPATEPEAIERRWQAQRGWPIRVPASLDSGGLTLVGLRTCLFHQGQMAHVMYDLRGDRVSLFVMPDRTSAAADTSVLGQRTRSWVRDGRTYVLVLPATVASVDDVAAYFEAQAR
jgi:anti-sigma factor RsiW